MTQMATPVALATLDDLIQQAGGGDPIRVAVVNAAQAAVLETLREAASRCSSAAPPRSSRPPRRSGGTSIHKR